jgi:transcriptional regulator with XRE-family HTH domain/tetratricopeptide (TPR) repeat protein
MAAAATPRVKLRQAREAACLTQDGLTEAVKEVEPSSGLHRSTVSKWEAGTRTPNARHRRALEKVLGRSAVELELISGPEPNIPIRVEAETLDNMDLGTRISRRQAITGAVGVGLVGLLPGTSLRATVASITGEPAGRPNTSMLNPEAVGHYQAMAQHLSAYYWLSPDAESVQRSAVALVDDGTSILSSTRGADRQAVARAAGQTALLAGRIAFFDFGQPVGSTGCYHAALKLAEEADDRGLEAAVLAHVAFIPGFSGDYHGAQEALERATTKQRRAGGALLRSWLHCVRGELAARAGHSGEARDQIRRAEESLQSGGTDPEWLDWYDTARLAAFRGYVELEAGQHTKAVETFAGSLAGLAPNAAKQKSVVHFDLASAYAPQAPELAVEHATTAMEGLAAGWYSTAADRLPPLLSALEGTTAAVELRDRARELLPAA